MKKFVAQILKEVANLIPTSFALKVRRDYQLNPTLRVAVTPLVRLLAFGSFSTGSNFVTFEAPVLTLEGNDSVVTRTVFWRGVRGYEGGEALMWGSLCREASQIVEVGANIGLFSVVGAMSNPRSSYKAFEPHPRVFASLEKNIRLNNLQNVRAFEAAVVGNHYKKSVIELSVASEATDWHDLPLGSSVRDGLTSDSSLGSNSILVVTMSSRDALHEANLVKIDAEGAEESILRGAVTDLASRGVTLVLEVLPRSEGLLRVISRFMELGYEVLEVGSNKLVSLSYLGQRPHSTSSLRSRDVIIRPRKD